jgi:arginine/ornithine transport system substrate-binding protein
MKKLLLAITLCALGATAFAQGKDLKVAIDPTYEPFTYKVDGKPTGFDVDIANACASRSNASVCLSSRAGTA